MEFKKMYNGYFNFANVRRIWVEPVLELNKKAREEWILSKYKEPGYLMQYPEGSTFPDDMPNFMEETGRYRVRFEEFDPSGVIRGDSRRVGDTAIQTWCEYTSKQAADEAVAWLISKGVARG